MNEASLPPPPPGENIKPVSADISACSPSQLSCGIPIGAPTLVKCVCLCASVCLCVLSPSRLELFSRTLDLQTTLLSAILSDVCEMFGVPCSLLLIPPLTRRRTCWSVFGEAFGRGFKLNASRHAGRKKQHSFNKTQVRLVTPRKILSMLQKGSARSSHSSSL